MEPVGMTGRLKTRMPPEKVEDFWFPGRWIGGASLVLGPTLLLAGVLLRIQVHFFFPEQLAAFNQTPTLMAASYSAFLAGNILLWPAIITLARLVGSRRPGWALWGGSLVMFGLFARTFHAGVDHLAAQLVRVQGLDVATNTVAASYGAWHFASVLSLSILAGWLVLAVGAYLSGTLGAVRAIALGLMSLLMIGVLKGSTLVSVVATVGGCIALVPKGVTVLRDGPTPGRRVLLAWGLCVVAFVALSYVVGRAG